MVRVVPLCIGQTALGTASTANVAIGGGDWDVPVWAKSILAMTIGGVTDLPTAAQSWLARSELTSNNVPIQPFMGFASPIGSVLGASGGNQYASKPEKYDINLRVNGGEKITPNMRCLVANTSANYGSIVLVVSDAAPIEAQRHIQAGTLTQDTVVNAANDGTQYSISGAKKIVELLGVQATTTIATSEGFIGRIRFTSSEFAGLNYSDLMLNPVPGGLATLGIAFVDGVSRQRCQIPVQQGLAQCNILDSMQMISSADIGAATSWCSAVAYE